MAQPSANRKRAKSATRATRTKSDRPGSSPQRDFARSSATDWKSPSSVISEKVALNYLKLEWERYVPASPARLEHRAEHPVMIADLHDFEIYVSGEVKARSFELLGLQHLEVPRSKKLLLDGFISIGAERHYVEGVSIHDYSIEGYGDTGDPTIVAYVQSVVAAKESTYDVWYRLNKPTEAYERHHTPFLWVAQLAKHVLDFIDEQPRRSVGLENFRSDFQGWVTTRFHGQAAFGDWFHALKDRDDFRVCIHAYIDFLYQQAYNLPNSKSLLTHPIWADCRVAGSSQVPEQTRLVGHTLTTPDVYECFKHMYFGYALRPMAPSNEIKAGQQRRMTQLGFATQKENLETRPAYRTYGNSPVQVGDIVAFKPKNKDTAKWKAASQDWLLYVHDVQPLASGEQRLFGMWLYRPRDTNIYTAKYKYENELFFSDHCNCDDGELLSTDIRGRYNIEWTPTVIPLERFFIRQTYVTQDSAFVTFSDEHKICECKKQKASQPIPYERGDSVYITKNAGTRDFLEPVLIHQIENTSHIVVRRLARLSRDLPDQIQRGGRLDLAANELALTDQYERVRLTQIQRKCHIRFVPKEDVLAKRIPFPYNRGGSGDFWFFSMGLIAKDGPPDLKFLARPPKHFKEGEDFASGPILEHLAGLSLFGGGGNFDRGIEEGGAVDIRSVIEWDAAAIHTQRVNAHDVNGKRLWCGSVDDHLKATLEGKHHELIARIGDVDIILAGSPCPGFSTLQQNITSDRSIKNASHITTMCSYADIHRPKYAVFENVVAIAANRKGFEDQNVLSQVVACFVSMGYQVNQYIMDAWTYGSCQQRSRVMVTIAAPGLVPIQQPKHTHSMLSNETAARSLGSLPNGQRFGGREYYSTPFAHISAGAATSDLPDIGNGNIQTCISHPNHRVSAPPSRKERALLACIPREPPCCGYAEAYKLGLIPSTLQKPSKESGRAYRRIHCDGLVPTITTGLSIQDSRNGATVHWSQDSPITILFARRTQGYLDHEPIIGTLAEQYKIVGNGVDRHVAFALGLAIRKAIVSNKQQDGVSASDMLVDVEQDDDHFSEAAGTCSADDSDLDADMTDIPGLDGTSDVRDNLPMAPPLHNSSLLLRVSKTITSGIKDLAHRSRYYPSPTPATSNPSKRSLEWISEGVDDGSFRHDDDGQASASREPNLVDMKETGNTAQDKVVRNGDVASKTGRVGTKSGYTRHSGLEVVFTPKQWNQKPEREHHTSD